MGRSFFETDMRALSIRQPWAWLIANGYKDIENRTWRTHYRGPLLIHASGGMTRDEYEDVADFVRGLNRIQLLAGSNAKPIVLPERDELARGGIIGCARLAGCIAPENRRSDWHMEGQYGFLMLGAAPVPFVPCKGKLGIFDVPEDVTRALDARQPIGSVA